MSIKLKINRNYGYDILINTFEPVLKKYVANEVFLVNFGFDWKKHVPQGVIIELAQTKAGQVPEDCSIDEFFEELTFLNLKDLLVASNNFKLAKSFFGELSKDKFAEIMDDLNAYRRKIAHAKSTFSELDLLTLKDHVKILCQGDRGEEVRRYLENEEYKNAKDIPPDFLEEYETQNNLPPESYDLDGGFVGREKEMRAIRNFIKSDQDRVITITGAGGVGKTALALRVAYSFLGDAQNPFEAIIWFSAKASKLADEGIVPLIPAIKSHEQLIEDIMDILDPKALHNFKEAKVPLDSYVTHLYNMFRSQKCLFIVDNLETVIKDDKLIKFIEEIPRPSQILITSRKGLGEFERRYPITDMLEKDAILLFRIIAKERNRLDLLRLKEETISSLVERVKCYPLLIKWSIGQVCLGKDIDQAFSQIFLGESEIAQFAFNDVFALLTDDAKTILYSTIIYGDKPVSRYVLMHLANLTDDQFEDAIKELILTSFVFPESKDTEAGTITEYAMLELTRGFVESRLDDDEKTRQMLSTRYYHLSEQIEEFEKSKRSYTQLLFSLGIKTPEEQVAFNYVKAAKNYAEHNEVEDAEKNFELALKIAPNLSYVLTEYSKFEFNRGHHAEGLKLAKRAIEVDPQSYHAWFNYGIALEKAHQNQRAIECLQKAKELNPKHLPIFTELGRVYTMIGDYEKAEMEFTEALKQEKYPNFRHKIITLYWLADNYKRWAESFSLRRDAAGQVEKLEQAFRTISEAVETAPRDKYCWKLYIGTCLDLGIALSSQKGLNAGKPYLEKCLQPIYVGRKLIEVDSKIIAKAYFYLAALSMKEEGRDIKKIENLIEQGLAICKDATWIEKLNGLRKELLEGKAPAVKADGKKYGKIKFYNVARKFGVIEGANETHIFLSSGLSQILSTETLYELEGKAVSYILVKSRKREDSYIAVDVTLL